jgi:hypothetical protein
LPAKSGETLAEVPLRFGLFAHQNFNSIKPRIKRLKTKFVELSKMVIIAGDADLAEQIYLPIIESPMVRMVS